MEEKINNSDEKINMQSVHIEDNLNNNTNLVQNDNNIGPQTNNIESECGCKGKMESECGCKGKMETSLVPEFTYVLGNVFFDFPTESIKREFFQAAYRAGVLEPGKPITKTESDILKELVEKGRLYYYLPKLLCWIVEQDNVPIYIIGAKTEDDYLALVKDLLTETPETPDKTQDRGQTMKLFVESSHKDLVVGLRGPIAPPNLCKGLTIPIIKVDQLDTIKLLDYIQELKDMWTIKLGVDKDDFEHRVEELFLTMMNRVHNAGTKDEDRALNYAAIRSYSIYKNNAVDSLKANMALKNISTNNVKIGNQKAVEIIFTFGEDYPGYSEYSKSILVDVTGEFPYMIAALRPHV